MYKKAKIDQIFRPAWSCFIIPQDDLVVKILQEITWNFA